MSMCAKIEFQIGKALTEIMLFPDMELFILGVYSSIKSKKKLDSTWGLELRRTHEPMNGKIKLANEHPLVPQGTQD